MSKKNKEDTSTEIEENSVFPEGHIMNEWSYDTDAGDRGVSKDRQTNYSDTENESDFFIPHEWWPKGYQLGWMVEYVLGTPQPDNLRRRQRHGWEFVHESEIPQLTTLPMDHEFDRGRNDGWIRIGGQILMKKPKEDYERDQEKKRMAGEEIRRQSEALTDYMGSGRDRFVVENKTSYQPNHKMRRG